MNVKQFYLGSTEPSNLNNSHGSLPCSKQNYGNLLPFQSSSPSLASSINWNKNSSAQHQTKVNESLTSNGSLTLLSQLVEWEKSKQPLRSNPSFNPTKAKTLEEIEQAESSRTNIFFWICKTRVPRLETPRNFVGLISFLTRSCKFIFYIRSA